MNKQYYLVFAVLHKV